MDWIQNEHADRPSLLEHAGTRLERACRSAIQRDGEAFLALAGGQTPLPLYASTRCVTPVACRNASPVDGVAVAFTGASSEMEVTPGIREIPASAAVGTSSVSAEISACSYRMV